MVQVTIDHTTVSVEPGSVILDAARRAGIGIPTLCHIAGCEPQTSCMVCVVKLQPGGKLVPACAYPVYDGLTVTTGDDDVLAVRRRNLELLLSDHLGDCLGPCTGACPAGMDIPAMIRHIAAGQLDRAVAVVKAAIPLPAVLGRICPAPCEGVCRRKYADEPLAICQLKRFVADEDLALPRPFLPECLPPRSRKVAIVGAGPAGLSAGWFLRLRGYSCRIFDRAPRPGGSLYQIDDAILPPEVIQDEAGLVERLGCEFQFNTCVGRDLSLDELVDRYDAVVLASGAGGFDGLACGEQGVQVEPDTMRTSREGVFAAGNVIRKGRLAIRSIGQARAAAAAVDQYLSGQPVTGWSQPFSCHIGKVREGEVDAFLARASREGRVVARQRKQVALTAQQASREAARCLHCDCLDPDNCRLRQVCAACGITAPRLGGHRPDFSPPRRTGPSGSPVVVYEPGKCIRCGLCVQITARHEQSAGLTFVGRGYAAFIDIPLDYTLDQALRHCAEACVRACPTAALAFDRCRPEEDDSA